MTESIDEMKLTAYALKELSMAEKAEVDEFLASHAEARGTVDQIRAIARSLEVELAREVAELPIGVRAPIILDYHRPVRRWWVTACVGVAAAAVLAVGLVWLVVPRQKPMVSMLPDNIALTTTPLVPNNQTVTKDSTIRSDGPHSLLENASPQNVAEKNSQPFSSNDAILLPRDVAARERQQSQTSNASDGNKDHIVSGLINDAQSHIQQSDYKRAIQDINQIQTVDPDNEYAKNVRMLIEDKAIMQQQREYKNVTSGEYNKQLNDQQPKPSFGVPSSPAGSNNQTFRDANGNVVVSTGDGRNLAWHGSVGNSAVPGSLSADSKNTTFVDPKEYGRYRTPDAVGPGTESYTHFADNQFLSAIQNPLSTFSVNVDTASYANIRRFLTQGQLPPPDAVRIEEMLNYFPYDYAGPKSGDESPLAVHVEVADCPWEPTHRLARVALKAKTVAPQERPASNLVFLIDVSGSMGEANKLDLLKQSLPLLVEKLTSDDHVSIVTYAGETGVGLDRTSGGNKPAILAAIDKLEANGCTNGGAGIILAYSTAVAGFIKGGVNRVILATDGDFNVGVTNPDDLVKLIEEKAKTGVHLSILGMGMGNVKDSTMEKLADHGNGNYAYIDSLEEANKVLSRQVDSTLITVAKDAKVQVEFNPAKVSGYRLIGYEDRALAKEDFNNDNKSAGEMGAGHAVTALYEIVPNGVVIPPGVDPLKYQAAAAPTTNPAGTELMTVKVRYKQPDTDISKKLEVPVTDSGETWATASSDFRFASAVVSFGMILRNSPYKGNSTFDQAIEMAGAAKGEDVGGYRTEFIELMEKARTIADP